VELLVGALVVLGFLAIVTRFIARDASGEIRLPRIVDDSIGMWALRRITGRRLWERPWDDELDEDHVLDPGASESTRAALAAIAAAKAADRTPSQPSQASQPAPVPTRYVAARKRTRVRSDSMLSPTPVLDLRRRMQARPKRPSLWRRLAPLGAAAAMLIVAVVAFGAVLQPRGPQGEAGPSLARPSFETQPVAVATSVSTPPRSTSLGTPSGQPTPTRPAIAGPTPPSTPARTPRPPATPIPTPKPTPTHIPKPTPTSNPTPTPTPTPTPDAPSANFTFSVSDTTATFTNTSTGTGLTWLWDFGDGQSSTDENPVHPFVVGATYGVTLTATDAMARTSVHTDQVVIP